ncbi:hypothetical protein BDZ89DRAFT_1120974 [Hymenopellis radicata]|nr:hypothetical protein BDZ89DRAFT_1120974 [Hymenopellis radicata]
MTIFTVADEAPQWWRVGQGARGAWRALIMIVQEEGRSILRKEEVGGRSSRDTDPEEPITPLPGEWFDMPVVKALDDEYGGWDDISVESPSSEPLAHITPTFGVLDDEVGSSSPLSVSVQKRSQERVFELSLLGDIHLFPTYDVSGDTRDRDLGFCGPLKGKRNSTKLFVEVMQRPRVVRLKNDDEGARTKWWKELGAFNCETCWRMSLEFC